MEENYPTQKLSTGKWIANFWYYYKWLFLFGLVVLAFVIIATVQFFSKSEPDASFLYVGPQLVSNAQCEAIVASGEAILREDYNGDGNKTIDLRTIALSFDYGAYIGAENNAEAQYNALSDYNNELLAGDCCILFLAPYFYNELANSDALLSLDFVLGDFPGEAEDYFGVPLSELKIYSLPGFSSLPADTMVCVRNLPVHSGRDEETAVRIQLQNEAAFCDIFAFTS